MKSIVEALVKLNRSAVSPQPCRRCKRIRRQRPDYTPYIIVGTLMYMLSVF